MARVLFVYQISKALGMENLAPIQGCEIMDNVTWQVIADIDNNMTVAFFLNDELFTIMAGEANTITNKLKRLSAAN